MELTTSILAESGFSNTLWAEAVSTAAYLWNRSPTKAVRGMTPFEVLYKKRPNVGLSLNAVFLLGMVVM